MMDSDSRDALPLTTEQKPEVAPNNSKSSPGIIQIPSKDLPLEEKLKLKNCGLPEKVLKSYSQKRIDTMLEWQLECLSKPGILTVVLQARPFTNRRGEGKKFLGCLSIMY